MRWTLKEEQTKPGLNTMEKMSANTAGEKLVRAVLLKTIGSKYESWLLLTVLQFVSELN